MKKSYKVKIIPSVGEAQTLEIAASKLSATTTLSAIPGGHYQLLETASGQAPDNIRVSRKGKDLRIHFEGSEQADLVISNYYANSAADPQALIGQTSNGNYHPYIPESGNATTTVAQLNDGMTTIGMALGSEPLALTDFTAAGIGVAAAAGFNPLWAAPLLLLGAGGGGAKSNLDTTPPPLKSAALFSADDTGVSATDGITGNNKPRITGVTEPNATVKVTLNGHVYTGQAHAQGRFAIPVTDPLPDGVQTYKVQANDAAGNVTTVDGTAFTVDTTAPAAPTGALYGPDDTGLSASDNITGNNIPRITGMTEPNAKVKITLNGQDYVGQADDQGRYLIQVTNALPNTLQTYKVQATDAAGNSTTADGTPFTVDASNVSTSQGVGISIDAITQDTGVSQTDFITGDNTLTWNGKLTESNTAKFNPEDWMQVQLVNAQSQVVGTQYLKPQLTAGDWKWTWLGDTLPLADGLYTLKAQLVDTAGNVLSATPWATTQSVTIDTQAQQLNGARDTNAGLSISNIKMTALTDTGLSQTDFVTNNRQPIFTGKVTGESAFNVDTGRVLAEVIDSTGKVVAFQYLTPSASGDWTFDNTANSLGVDKAVTTYTLKTAIVDMAGHFMNATSQAFTVDLKTPVVSLISTSNQPVNLPLQYTELGFSTNEQGVYFFNGDLQTGSKLNLGRVIPFAAQEFNLVFRDTAGNEQKITNDKTWDLSPISGSITLAKGSAGPSGFGDGQLLGSVGPNNGKYEMTSGENLDLSTLYSLTPTQGSNGANGGINHFVMGAGAQTLTVSIGDVLQLGLSNSFLKDDRVQMRIDGDGADKLNVTKQWANSTDQGWVVNQQPLTLVNAGIYHVYTNDNLKLDLLVKSEIQVTVI